MQDRATIERSLEVAMLVLAQVSEVSDPHVDVDGGGRSVRRAAFHLFDGTRLTSHVRVIL